MQHVEPSPSTPTVDLVKEAILDTRELLLTEIEVHPPAGKPNEAA